MNERAKDDLIYSSKMAKQQYPEPTAGALIFNPDGKILLMKSHKWKGKYTIPGGHIELGETIEDAVKREIKEETGLDVYDIEFLMLQEFVYEKAFWKKRHFIFLDYTCKTNSSDVHLNSEGQEHIWVSPRNALKLPIPQSTRKVIKEYLKKYKSYS